MWIRFVRMDVQTKSIEIFHKFYNEDIVKKTQSEIVDILATELLNVDEKYQDEILTNVIHYFHHGKLRPIDDGTYKHILLPTFAFDLPVLFFIIGILKLLCLLILL